MVHQRTQRIDVGAGVHGPAILLGRRIALRAHHRAALALLQGLCNAEIDQDDLVLWRKNHVGGLEVAKDDGWLMRMEVLQDIAQLHGPAANRLFS